MIDRCFEGTVLHTDEQEKGPIVPGCRVKHKDDIKSRGIVVAIEVTSFEVNYTQELVEQHTIHVLWSCEHEVENPFSRFMLPAIKSVSYHSISQKLVSVQPMSMSSGNIFYTDYTYGSKSVSK